MTDSHHAGISIGLVLTLVVMLAAITSFIYTPYDPLAMDMAVRLQGPSKLHLLGTDHYGRDLLSRMMVGAVTSLSVGVAAVLIGLGAGLGLGMLAGYRGGWLDEGFMRLMDALYGFPAVLSALLIAAVLGPGMGVTMVAIGIASVPIFARLTRGEVLRLRAEEFVLAGQALGAGHLALMARHILPNCIAPLVIQSTAAIPLAILGEAGLSYLGLGTQPPHPSWGLMLKEAQTFLAVSPWFAISPGIGIAITVLGFNLLGDGLRDRLDPRTG